MEPIAARPSKDIRQAEGRIFLVAVNEDDEPIGYGDLEPSGHIDHLYCQPDMIGMGVGSTLYAALESAARQSGIAVLFVEANDAARRLFERWGFTVQSRNNFEVNGVMIHSYRMTKVLGPGVR